MAKICLLACAALMLFSAMPLSTDAATYRPTIAISGIEHPKSIDVPPTVERVPLKTVDEKNILVANVVRYRVRRGDTLGDIASRYGVSSKALRSQELNPSLAKRKNPNLLYRGETITIPVYTLTIKPKSKIRASELVVTPNSEIKKDEAALTAATNKTKTLERVLGKWYHQPVVLVLIFVVGVVGVFTLALALFLLQSKKAVPDVPHHVESRTEATKPQSAEELLALLQTVKGSELERLVDLTLTPDEVGNFVTIKKVREFLTKRDYLRDKVVSDWGDAMATVRTQTTAESTQKTV